MKQKAPTHLRYVLITPARNEASYIEKTIESVVAQTARPVRWVIVSDGSTDGTDDIVGKHAARHDWIELVRLPERKERHFGGKVSAFNAGRARVNGLEHEVIGNLDADVSFDSQFFAFLLHKLEDDPELGAVTTPYRDPIEPPYDYRFASIEHVTGPCQVFRRRCFDDIGGFTAAKDGNIDRIADIASRMKGWKTRTFTEKVYLHHRHTGTAQKGVLRAKFHDGRKDYLIGTSPVWEIFRTIYQMTKRPFIIGSVMMACGFIWTTLRRAERPVSPEMVAFCRREQLDRLRDFFSPSRLFNLVSPNCFTFPVYIPRICRQCRDWPRYLFNYLSRKEVPAVYRLREGFQLADDSGSLAGTMAVVFFRREYGSLGQLRTIVDAGANIGCFAIYAAQSCPKAKIYCYEPERQNFEALNRNIGLNGLGGRVTTVQNAVASTHGPREMAVGDSNLLNSFYIIPPHAHSELVNCTTLKEIIAAHRLETIDLLKINCEGSEYEILEACSDAEFKRISSIRLEYHNIGYPKKNGEALVRFLEARGYRMQRFSRYMGKSGFIWATRLSDSMNDAAQ